MIYHLLFINLCIQYRLTNICIRIQIVNCFDMRNGQLQTRQVNKNLGVCIRSITADCCVYNHSEIACVDKFAA